MSEIRVGEHDCQQVLSQMDAYVDETLAPEAVNALKGHVDRCPACERELKSREFLRTRLKSAVRNSDTPAHLETRIRAHIRATADSKPWKARLIAVAAAVLVCVGAVISYQLGHLRLTAKSQESYIASVNNQVAQLMRVGLGDHVHCSVFRKFPVNPPTLDEMTSKLGPEFSGLIPIVKQHVPDDFRLVMAHQCRYHERKFVHLALKSNDRLLSLVIARKSGGESFSAEALLPALSESGIPVYAAGVQRFRIAAFESSAFLVYVISDLPQQKNMELMRAMAPALQNYLRKLES